MARRRNVVATIETPDSSGTTTTTAGAAPRSSQRRETPSQQDTPAANPAGTKKLRTAGKWLGGIAVGLVVGRLLLAWFGWWPLTPARPKPTIKAEVQHRDVDLKRMRPVFCDTLAFLMNTPFYTTVPYDAFQEGDVVELTATGAGGFDRYLRTLVGDRVSPNGWTKCPEDLGSSQDPEKYLIRGKGVHCGALVGGFGTVRYNEKEIAYLAGSQHFLIGKKAYVTVPDLDDRTMHLTSNEKWTLTSWEDNIGGFTVIYTVYRPIT
ncbi:MAG: hypothetical protein HY340_00670 [Candidatus Kerfeldbacteria bacterium]|nr:hypothetical protein [Candidatus Kerfeldbacteria bacterium]